MRERRLQMPGHLPRRPWVLNVVRYKTSHRIYHVVLCPILKRRAPASIRDDVGFKDRLCDTNCQWMQRRRRCPRCCGLEQSGPYPVIAALGRSPVTCDPRVSVTPRDVTRSRQPPHLFYPAHLSCSISHCHRQQDRSTPSRVCVAPDRRHTIMLYPLTGATTVYTAL